MAVPREDQLLFLLDPLRLGSLASKRRYVRELIKPTFTRGSIGTASGRDGAPYTFAVDVPRIEYVDLDGDGVRETPGLLLEGQRTNLILRSEELNNATWIKENTPIVTDGALALGCVTLSLVNKDTSGVLERIRQAVTFTVDGTKAIRLLVKAGTSQYSSVQLYDGTVPATRFITIITWAAGVPSFNTTVGSVLKVTLLANGIYELLVQAPNVVAANSHTLFLNPASGITGFETAPTGTTYFGAVQAENGPFPSSYIKTTSATVTRSPDRLEYPYLAGPQAMTILADFLERAHPNWVTPVGGGDPRIMQNSNSGNTATFRLIKANTSDSYRFVYNATGTDWGSTVDLNPVFGDRIELRATLTSGGLGTLYGSKNGATEVAASPATAEALPAAWGLNVLNLGSVGAAGQGDILLLGLTIAVGSFTRDEMRAA